ncbi:unnamed protein product [Prunus armeniaca]|uniref:Uncharacterized protein n=1 Tax=Prunus armeniaca TaxID=36596 RepID=A0A6J5XC38_PRUAR|nr:unnamed protein product [Prunus armeniaca]
MRNDDPQLECPWFGFTMDTMSFKGFYQSKETPCGVYGNPTNLWKHSSNLLRWLAGDVSGPWVLGRDFNEIVAAHEYMGKCFRPMSQMRDFGDALEECDLAPIPYTLYKYM